MKLFTSVAFSFLVGLKVAPAALTDNLIAYYNFEEPATAGIANKALAATSHNGAYLNGTSFGAGSGFAGNAAFAGAEAGSTTNRSTLLLGNALNLAKSDAGTTSGSGQFVVDTLTSRGAPPTVGDYGTLGTQFAISAWFYLAPDADNTGTNADILRDFVFESRLNGTDATAVFDVSFGTTDANGTTYASYVASVTAAGNNRTLSANAWHHVVHSFATSDVNTVMSVYVDGTLVGTGSAATTTMDFRGIIFGANRNGARIFDGMLDEIGVWNRPLSAPEATELYQLGSTGHPLLPVRFSLSLAASPVNGGTVTGSGIYDSGTNVAITATPNPGYVFSNWTGNFAGQPASFSYNIDSSVVASAIFAQDFADNDGDGLSNYEEIVVYHTLPNNPDSDGDTIRDGAEVNITLTDPATSDAALISLVEQNLTASHAGAIALSPPEIAGNPATETIQLALSLDGSLDKISWQSIDLTQPSASITPSGDGWDITCPAPSNLTSTFVVLGRRL